MLILLDLDDTLIPNAEAFDADRKRLWQTIAELTGRPQADVVDAFVHPWRQTGYGRARTVGAAIHAYWRLAPNPRLEEILQVTEAAEALFDASRSPYPGVPEALSRLRGLGARLAVVTMGDPSPQSAKVLRAGLHRYVEDVFVLEDKNEETLRGVLETLGAERFLFVGNSPAKDILPAVSLGGHAVWVGEAFWPSEQADSRTLEGHPRVHRAPDLPSAMPWIEAWLRDRR